MYVHVPAFNQTQSDAKNWKTIHDYQTTSYGYQLVPKNAGTEACVIGRSFQPGPVCVVDFATFLLIAGAAPYNADARAVMNHGQQTVRGELAICGEHQQTRALLYKVK